MAFSMLMALSYIGSCHFCFSVVQFERKWATIYDGDSLDSHIECKIPKWKLLVQEHDVFVTVAYFLMWKVAHIDFKLI